MTISLRTPDALLGWKSLMLSWSSIPLVAA
jgi:hypothetical protein